MHYTELEANIPEETFDWAYVDIGDVQPLRVGSPRYDGIRKMLEELPQGQAIYIARPEMEDIQGFINRLRAILAQWIRTRDWAWSIRRDHKDRGVIVLRAIPRIDVQMKYQTLPSHPVGLPGSDGAFGKTLHSRK